MLKWPLKITKEDMDKLTVSSTLITNRRWLMEHKTFLALLRPPDRPYWEKLFASELPIASTWDEVSGTMSWKVDGSGMSHPMETLWRTVREPTNEIELEATHICISKIPEATHDYRLRQMFQENGTPTSEQEFLGMFGSLFTQSPEEYYIENEPVRIYTTDNVQDTGNLNTGLPQSCWPLTQLGDLYVTGGRLRDFIRIRRMYNETNTLMAVVAPCPCEWIEDISNICLRQGGTHKDNEAHMAGYAQALRRLVELSNTADLPIEPRNKCQRTLIFD